MNLPKEYPDLEHLVEQMNARPDSFEVWSGLKPGSTLHGSYRTYDGARNTARRIMLSNGQPTWIRRIVDGRLMWLTSPGLAVRS